MMTALAVIAGIALGVALVAGVIIKFIIDCLW